MRTKQLEALAQSAEKKAAASQRDLVRVEEELRKVRDNIAYLSLAQGPVGTIAAFAGPWPPRREDGTTWVESDLGWLPCDGKEIDSQEYPQLYAVLQKTWGEGQKSQTVKIPDLRGQFLRGADDMGRKAANVDPVKGRKWEARKISRDRGSSAHDSRFGRGCRQRRGTAAAESKRSNQHVLVEQHSRRPSVERTS